jgi:hypothetical protein
MSASNVGKVLTEVAESLTAFSPKSTVVPGTQIDGGAVALYTDTLAWVASLVA